MNDDLERRVKGLFIEHPAAACIAAMRAYRESQDALMKYGVHLLGCELTTLGGSTRCTCGLRVALGLEE